MLDSLLTKAVVEKVAIAVFTHAAKALLPEDKIRRLAGRDPEMLAFQAALARGYATFVKLNAEYAESFFDEHFLTGPAAPLLSRCMSRDDPPSPSELVTAWAGQFGASVDAARRRHATPVAADFLRILRAELKARAELREKFDSQALDRIASAAESGEAQRAELQETIAEGLAAATDELRLIRSALDAGPSAALRRFVEQASTGTPQLRDYYLDPAPVFRRLDVDSFTGREWLLDDLDAFLADERQQSGAWLLIADAGRGKSAFMAHLARRRNYVHVFMEQARGAIGTTRAIQSLAMQLITRFQISPYVDQDALPENLAGLPDFLGRILEDAAQRLRPGERLPILIDALDEADRNLGGNVLGLPQQLPDGVFLVVSSRPTGFRLTIDPPPRRAALSERENERDIHLHVARLVEQPWLATRLRDAGVDADAFVATVEERCGGNWMYLHYLFRDLAADRRAELLRVEHLPVGLAGYYADYWLGWRERKDWSEISLPLLATLGAVAAPTDEVTLAAWARAGGVPTASARKLLREDWAAFVQDVPGKPVRYQPYHQTLRDFIRGDLQREFPSPAAKWLVEELAEATVAAHARIAAAIEAEASGDVSALADGYGRRHLSFHLHEAGRSDRLRELVESEDWFLSQDRASPEGSYYLADLSEARAASRAWAEEGRTPAPHELAHEAWCALAVASLHDRSSRLPVGLVSQLVTSGRWTPEQALTAVRITPDPWARAKHLLELLPVLTGDTAELAGADLVDALLQLPEDSARHRGAYERKHAWSVAAEKLTPGAADRAVRGLARHDDEDLAAEALSTLLETGAARADAALAIARTFNFRFTRATVIAGALQASAPGPALTAEALGAFDDETLWSTFEVLDHKTAEPPPPALLDALRARGDAMLAMLAARGAAASLTAAERARVREVCLRERPSPETIAASLASGSADGEDVARALDLARSIDDAFLRAEALIEVAKAAPPAASEAIDAVAALPLEEQPDHVCTLARIATTRESLERIVSIAPQYDNYTHAAILEEAAERLDDGLRRDAMRGLMSAMDMADASAGALATALATVAPDDELRALLGVLESLRRWERTEPLATIAKRAGDDVLPEVAHMLSRSLSHVDWDARAVLEVLVARGRPELLVPTLDAVEAQAQELLGVGTILEAVLPHIAAEHRRRGLAVASALSMATERVDVLLGVAEAAPELREAAVEAATETALAATREHGRAACLAQVLPHITDRPTRATLIEAALDAARTIGDDTEAMSRALPLLASFRERVAQLASEVAEHLEHSRRVEWLVAVAPWLEGPASEPVFATMLATASRSTGEAAAKLLEPLLRLSPPPTREQAYESALELLDAAGYLPPSFLEAVLETARELGRDLPTAPVAKAAREQGVSTWKLILPRLLPTLGNDALVTMSDLAEGTSTQRWLWEQAAIARPDLRERADERLRRLLIDEDPGARALVAASLLKLTPDRPDREQLVATGFTDALAADDMAIMKVARGEALAELASVLRSDEATRAIAAAQQLDADVLASVLKNLAGALDGDGVGQAAETADALDRETLRYGGAVTPLVERLVELGDVDEAVALASRAAHPVARTQVVLSPTIARAQDDPEEALRLLRDVIALPPKTYMSLGPGYKSWRTHRPWQARAASQLLTALDAHPAELDEAIDIVADGGFLLDCMGALLALAESPASRATLAPRVWRSALVAPAETRVELVGRLVALLPAAQSLAPALKASELGDVVLDVLRRWP